MRWVNQSKYAGREGHGISMLPRFGIRLFMNRNFDDVEYFGIGPDESYIDK